ncbi:thiol reductant ABC exporter subunit CydD [Paenibacillus lautus]
MKRNKNLIAQHMSAQRKYLVLLGIISFALGTAIVGQASLLAEAVQRIFVEKASFSSVAMILGMLLAIMALRTLLSFVNGRIGLHMAATAKINMRESVLQNLTRVSMGLSLQGQTGERVSVALDAVDEADSYFSQYIPKMVEAMIIPILVLIVTFTQHANSGWIMIFTAPFIPIFMILVGLKTKNKSEEKYEQLANFSGTFLDSLQGLVTLKIFGRTQRQQQEIERSSLNYRDTTMDILKIAFMNTFMLESIVMLSIGVVALELAIQLVVYKSMTFHTAFLVLLLVPEFYNLLKNTGTAFHSGRTSMGAIRKIESMLEKNMMESYISDGKNRMPNFQMSHAKPLPVPPSIELKNVRFKYAPDSFEFHSGSVFLKPGDNIAIVGKSGAGKTTLLHLIAGLLKPDSGIILVNGNPLSQDNEEVWFKHVSYITQHPYIFAGTFEENIAIGAGRDVSRAEIEKAAEEAGLTAVAAQLDKGFDTFVGEGGRGLSGGEKQRLALARAFLKRPAIILFDEPTVGLDLHTESILQRSISTLSKTSTMITVAHRLYTIQHATNILFVDHGSIVDSGCHEELLKRLPQYAEMVAVQQKGGLA